MQDAVRRAAPPASVSRLKVWIALLTVYVVWGSTYLAIRIALEGWPPFAMAAVRFLAAGAIMVAFLRWRGTPWPTARQWRNCAITGTLLLAGGNGMVCFAELTVSSSLAAVAVAVMPLFAALFAGLYGKWPAGRDWIGLAIGFAGVIALNLGGEMRGSPAGAIALLLAPIAWAFGSVWSKHQDMPDPFMSTAAQMLTGSVALAFIAAGMGEALPASPSLKSTLALVYLVVFGSILAFTAYVYLLNRVRPALATSYAYVNPPIAVLFGVLLAGEHFGVMEAVAMAVILAGVAVILTARKT
jgi:drug/metabolite transporter (DMT)-like permease